MKAIVSKRPVSEFPSKKASSAYVRLRERVRSRILLGKKRAEEGVKREIIRTYWDVGRMIDRHVRTLPGSESGRAAYGKKVIQQLSQELGYNPTYLYNAQRFAKRFPILSPATKLDWSHYRALAFVASDRTRKRLADQAAVSGWGWRTLQKKVREVRKTENLKNPAGGKNEILPPELLPRRGVVGISRILGSEEDPPVRIDLGFRNSFELNFRQAGLLKKGDLVARSAAGRLRKTRDAGIKDLYTYSAQVARVVDGDTQWVRIDLGFGVRTDQKLRLRGIDCPERGTKRGEAAKRFVENELKGLSHITVTSTKPDKYDRYLTDLYYEKDGREIFLNQLLLDKGFAVLKNAVRPEDWDAE